MKLSDKHLELFKKHVAIWQGQLGLTGWRLLVEWEKEDHSARAITRLNHKSHQATITLVRDQQDAVNAKEFEDYSSELAFHEVLHILLSDLTTLAENNTHPNMYDFIQSAEHGVIRTFENLIFRVLKK